MRKFSCSFLQWIVHSDDASREHDVGISIISARHMFLRTTNMKFLRVSSLSDDRYLVPLLSTNVERSMSSQSPPMPPAPT